jgi:hypothetical protein
MCHKIKSTYDFAVHVLDCLIPRRANCHVAHHKLIIIIKKEIKMKYIYINMKINNNNPKQLNKLLKKG